MALIKSAVPTRNKRICRGDALAIGYPVNETSSTVATNIGSLRFPPVNGADGTYSAEPTWDEDAEGRFANLQGSQILTVITPADAVTWPEGYILLRCAYRNASSTAKTFFTTGGTPTSNDVMSIVKTATATWRFRLNVGATQHSFECTPATFGTTVSAVNTFIMSWGPRGLRVWINGTLATAGNSTVVGTPTAITAGPITGPASSYFVSNAGLIDLYGFYHVTAEAETADVEELTLDPHLLAREHPTALWATWSGPLAWRTTYSGTHLRMVSADDLSGTAYWRTRYSTSLATLEAATPTSAASTSTAGAASSINLTGLTIGTRYYRLDEWSADGVTYYPFPGGFSTFVTQRPRGQSFSWIPLGDDHVMSEGDGVPDDDTGFGYDSVWTDADPGVAQAEGRKFLAAWRCGRHIYLNQTHDFMLLMGDNWYLDRPDATLVQINADMFAQAAGFWNFWHHALKRGTVFSLIGNHEFVSGYQQAWDNGDSAPQRQAQEILWLFCGNPDNTTYPQGGELNSYDDWTPTFGDPWGVLGETFNAAYFEKYITRYRNEAYWRATSLLNYYGFSWGDMDMFVRDDYRYTDPGANNAAGSLLIDPGVADLGETQWAWLEQGLKSSTAIWKCTAGHTTLGGGNTGIFAGEGEGYYLRDSGVLLGDGGYYADQTPPVAPPQGQERLHQLRVENGVAADFGGHDHKYARVEKRGVIMAKCCTPCAPSHIFEGNAPGWHNFELNYGPAELLGLDALGEMAAKGMLKHYNTLGYEVVYVSPTSMRSKLWQTHYTTFNEDDAELNYVQPAHRERFIANSAVAPSSNAITLAFTPKDVAGVYDTADVEPGDEFWDAPPANRQTAGRTEWSAEETVATDDIRIPTNGSEGLQFRSDTDGDTGASEPTWPDAVGETVVDGDITWTAERLTRANKYDGLEDGNNTTSVPVSSESAVSVKAMAVPSILYEFEFPLALRQGSASRLITDNGTTIIAAVDGDRRVVIDRIKFSHSAAGAMQFLKGASATAGAIFNVRAGRTINLPNLNYRGDWGERISVSLPSTGSPRLLIDFHVEVRT